MKGVLTIVMFVTALSVAESEESETYRKCKKLCWSDDWISISLLLVNWHGDYTTKGPYFLLQKAPSGKYALSVCRNTDFEAPVIVEMLDEKEAKLLRDKLLDVFKIAETEVSEAEKKSVVSEEARLRYLGELQRRGGGTKRIDLRVSNGYSNYMANNWFDVTKDGFKEVEMLFKKYNRFSTER